MEYDDHFFATVATYLWPCLYERESKHCINVPEIHLQEQGDPVFETNLDVMQADSPYAT